MTLEKLIPQYAQNKSELDSYKKICDEENKKIKNLMNEQGLTEKEAGNYIAKCITQKRESMNEDKVLEIAHQHGLFGIIKTKEYIDFDALESAIYNGSISTDILVELDSAKEVKEVATLRITKKKEKKSE